MEAYYLLTSKFCDTTKPLPLVLFPALLVGQVLNSLVSAKTISTYNSNSPTSAKTISNYNSNYKRTHFLINNNSTQHFYLKLQTLIWKTLIFTTHKSNQDNLTHNLKFEPLDYLFKQE